MDGKLHRVDGPALTFPNGDEYWYLNGGLHRVDGPAIKHADGREECYLNGKRHRADGSAVKYTDGKVEYWIEGKRLSKRAFLARTKPSCAGKVVEIDGKKYKLTVV